MRMPSVRANGVAGPALGPVRGLAPGRPAAARGGLLLSPGVEPTWWSSVPGASCMGHLARCVARKRPPDKCVRCATLAEGHAALARTPGASARSGPGVDKPASVATAAWPPAGRRPLWLSLDMLGLLLRSHRQIWPAWVAADGNRLRSPVGAASPAMCVVRLGALTLSA